MNRIQPFIFIGIGFLVVVLLLVVLGPGRAPSKPKPVTLEFWGVTDDEETWRPVFEEYRKENPHVTVNYRRLDEKTYEDTLINRLAEGKGPDIFLLKNSWVLKHRDKLLPLPQDSFGFFSRDFQKIFVDGARDDLVGSNGEILGLPLYIDTPALFYNKDIFNASGIAEPPKTWEEVLDVSQRLTKVSPAGDVTRSGLALGTFQNVAHAFEILSTLILQYGDSLISRNNLKIEISSKTADAISFYASFSDPFKKTYSWSARLPDSLDALAEGTAAMALGLAGDVSKLQQKNPHLNFGVAPFPQKVENRTPVVYATFFFPTVSKQTKAPTESWRLLAFLVSREGAEKYLEATKRPAARRDLLKQRSPTEELEVFERQALIAKTWPVPDEGASRRLFQEAIESVVSKTRGPEEAASRLREQMQLLIP